MSYSEALTQAFEPSDEIAATLLLANQDISADYSAEHNLGITPGDLLQVLRYCGAQPSSTAGVVPMERLPSRPLLDDEKLRKYLNGCEEVLTGDQNTAIGHFSWEVGIGKDDQYSFWRGYTLYIAVASDADKIHDFRMHRFEDLCQATPNMSDWKNVETLRRIGRAQVPLLSDIGVQLYRQAFPDEDIAPDLFTTGVGLAYMHCKGLVEQALEILRVPARPSSR